MARLPIDPKEPWAARVWRQQAYDDAMLAWGNVADPPRDLATLPEWAIDWAEEFRKAAHPDLLKEK